MHSYKSDHDVRRSMTRRTTQRWGSQSDVLYVSAFSATFTFSFDCLPLWLKKRKTRTFSYLKGSRGTYLRFVQYYAKMFTSLELSHIFLCSNHKLKCIFIKYFGQMLFCPTSLGYFMKNGFKYQVKVLLYSEENSNEIHCSL